MAEPSVFVFAITPTYFAAAGDDGVRTPAHTTRATIFLAAVLLLLLLAPLLLVYCPLTLVSTVSQSVHSRVLCLGHPHRLVTAMQAGCA
jgi:hypothetical protein